MPTKNYLSIIIKKNEIYTQQNKIFLYHNAFNFDKNDYRYAEQFHDPGSGGPLNLPFQRPKEACRRFVSSVVDSAIESLASKVHMYWISRYIITLLSFCHVYFCPIITN